MSRPASVSLPLCCELCHGAANELATWQIRKQLVLACWRCADALHKASAGDRRELFDLRARAIADGRDSVGVVEAIDRVLYALAEPL